jgi:hypothetical protein
MIPLPFSAIAFNQATESENRIHSDEIARRYGFRGGLVPGVTMHAYLVQPAVDAWGLDFLSRGGASVLLRQPLYDGERFEVVVGIESSEDEPGDFAYSARLLGEDGTLRAEAEVWLRQQSELPSPPTPRGAPMPPPFDDRPHATRDQLERLRPDGLGALRIPWNEKVELTQTSRDLADMPDLIRQDRGGYATPAFTLGLANWVLTRNVVLGPWIHVQSRVQHFAPVALQDELVVEASITDLFEKRGNEFVDLAVAAFRERDGAPVLTAEHRAIYVLRERGE